MSGCVLVKTDDRVATVILNRPDRLNAMNDELLDDLVEALEGVASDPSLGAVVITGAGRGFCAGGDLASIAEEAGDAPLESRITMLRRHTRAAELLREMPAVTIAAVNGPCAGAGLSLAAAADLRIAGESAVFRTAFLTAGMSGDFGGSWSLTHLLGAAKARELYLLNAKVSAAEAHRIGLVSSVVPDDALPEEAARTAAQAAASAPLARAGMKANLNEAVQLSFAESLMREAERHVRCALSDDAAEAGSAFLERRTPVFHGR
jgi:2-(1,2-epoxy-1,2-dihydrophenyl)acetyl-CoA isomerase